MMPGTPAIFCAWTEKIPLFARDRRGNIAMMFAFLAPVLFGGLGVGMESSKWYVDQRMMQNASAAAALASSGDATDNYAAVARSIAMQYGFQDGVGGATVSVSDSALCPAGGNGCYNVSITYKQQLYFLPVVGFRGDTTANGQPAQTLRATATAAQATT